MAAPRTPATRTVTTSTKKGFLADAPACSVLKLDSVADDGPRPEAETP